MTISYQIKNCIVSFLDFASDIFVTLVCKKMHHVKKKRTHVQKKCTPPFWGIQKVLNSKNNLLVKVKFMKK